MKIYTKTGDQGQTSLIGGTRVTKNHLRLEAYGSLDELNSHIGAARTQLCPSTQPIDELLLQIQTELFNLGSQLACPDAEISKKLPDISTTFVTQLEVWMDAKEAQLPPLQNFILPGGSLCAAHLHIARTVCRRAERSMMALHQDHPLPALYLELINRLSDVFFIMARWVNFQQGLKDELWTS